MNPAPRSDGSREVGIPQPERVLRLYPHQLSGGMQQRALIAMVVALEPDLIIADEPTTNLDNIVERQILDLFRSLRRRLRSAIIFITHDMTVAEALCDGIAVMYAGEVVETGAGRSGVRRSAASLHARARRDLAGARPPDRSPARDSRRAADRGDAPAGLPVRAALRSCP